MPGLRTPKEAFETMCIAHGQIWHLGIEGWTRITKEEDGSRTKTSGVLPPICVFDLLSYSKGIWAYFHLGHDSAELLVSRQEQRALVALHSIDLLRTEHARLAMEQAIETGHRRERVAMIGNRVTKALNFGGDTDDTLRDPFDMSFRKKDDDNVN